MCALIDSPANVPIPLGDGTTSSGPMGRPSVLAVAYNLRQWPVNFIIEFSECVAMFNIPYPP